VDADVVGYRQGEVKVMKLDPVDLAFAALILVAYSVPFLAMLAVSILRERKHRASQKARLDELTGHPNSN
jgi:hypothetical protein